jgi:L-iditol 2-dehydrogenase
MKAAVLHGIRDLRLEEVPEPKITAPDEVLVRVRWVGVCGSDVHYYTRGRVGGCVVESAMILGHECSGEVVEVGAEVKGLVMGTKVAMEPGVPCRRCEHCHGGRYNLCPDIVFWATPPVDGSLTEYVVMPQDFVFRLPEGMSLLEGALMEPLATGVAVGRRGEVAPGRTVAILGAGPIGLMCLQVCCAFGADRVAVTDIRSERLERALALGADATIEASGDVVERLRQELGRQGPDIVIEAAGTEETTRQAIEAVRPGGTVVLVGIAPEPAFPVNVARIIQSELQVRGLFRYANTFATAVSLCARGAVDVKSLVTHTFPLERVVEAYELAATGAGVKMMIEIP